jgi:arsenate reductase
LLQALINYIQSKISSNQDIKLNFICTHNSRRSHLCQVWAQTLSSYYNIKNVFCYSGGTEITSLFPAVNKALINSGFKIEPTSLTDNSVYSIKFSDVEPPILGFSKLYNDNFNPSSKFAAILTCTSADKGCPFIKDADVRISIPFEDPKLFDGTPQQDDKYLQRSLQIATELKYVFSKINQ